MRQDVHLVGNEAIYCLSDELGKLQLIISENINHAADALTITADRETMRLIAEHILRQLGA